MRFYRRRTEGPWHVDFWHNGRRFRPSTGTAELKQAKEWAEQHKAALWRADRLGERPAVTWDQAVIEWVEAHGHLDTLELRKSQLRVAGRYFAGKAIETIDRAAMEDLGKKIAKTGITDATVNRYLGAISAVLGYAVKRGHIKTKPPVPKRRETGKRLLWATHGQAEKLIAHLPKHLAPLVRFSLATGVRKHNGTHLEWSQVDLVRRVAWIEADQAKAGKLIALQLNDEALAVLKAQRSQHRRWVFPFRGKAMDNPAQKAYKTAVKAAGLSSAFDWHSLRHTWASWHVQNGTPLAVLMQLGGWASYAMVLRYAHLAPSHLATYAGNSSATGHKTGHTEEFPGRGRRATPKNGRPCRDRTYDQRIKSPLLYQLS
jgi:integrase